jgi:hypothetical protein
MGTFRRKAGLSEEWRPPGTALLELRRADDFVYTHREGADARKSVPLILNLVTEGEISMSPIAHRTMPFSLLAAA